MIRSTIDMDFTVEQMLKDGFSEKMARAYLNMLEIEKKNNFFDKDYIEWAHNRGFRANTACICGIDDSNYKEFLTDYDYYRIWPINNWTRIWINDKLTLKYMLSHTEFDSIMPEYYYYTAPEGLRALIDNPYRNDVADEKQFLKLLSEKKIFACKPCNGSLLFGFFMMRYESGKFYVGEDEINENEIELFLQNHPNYVFTEFIKPGGILAEISPQIHTLRIVTVNIDGANPKIIGGYLRVTNHKSTEGNLLYLDEDDTRYNVFTNVNFATGEFFDGRKEYVKRAEKVSVHPDSKTKLSGKIENYDELLSKVIGIAKRFNNIEYMGFDIGVTDKGFKCMEINSHPGIGYVQMYRPLFADPFTEKYFKSKIDKINSLSDVEKLKRNGILR